MNRFTENGEATALTIAGGMTYNFIDTGYREGGVKMANQVGKRYRCTKCGAEMIITKGGDGTIMCCGQPMEQKQ